MVCVITGIVCFVAGFSIAAGYNSNTYDKGFDDGWNERGAIEKHLDRIFNEKTES